VALRRICLLATAASIAACCGQAIAAGTWRVDYFHTSGLLSAAAYAGPSAGK
jgi:hypothetical protein